MIGSWFGSRMRDREQDMKALSATPTLYGVVTKLARMTSLVDWDLCKKTDDPDADPEPLVGKAAERAAPLAVWRRPNPHMHGQYFRQGSQQHKDLTGEFWWVIERFGGMPVELWPVRPDRMFPVPGVDRFLAGYVYRSPDGEEIPLGLDDVLSSFLPSPLDPYRGESPVGAVAADLAQTTAQSEWNAALYRNSANPGGIIKMPRRVSDQEFEELMFRWRAQHQGVANAGRIALLEEADFIPLSYTQKDMQFAEVKGLTRQAIFDAYGFPKYGLGDVDDVNRASASALDTLMANTLTIPRLEDMKSVLNGRFLPMFGPAWAGYEFTYRSPVPEDQEGERADLTTRANAFKVLIDARVEPDDAAEVCGLPPMKVREPDPVVMPAQGAPGVPDERQEKPDGGKQGEQREERQAGRAGQA